MCLICNRSSIAVMDEVAHWFEANAVKAAVDIGQAMSHVALMWSDFERVDHFGGDISNAVKEGKQALALLDGARSRYAENRLIAMDYGLNEKISSRLKTLDEQEAAKKVDFTGPKETWAQIFRPLKEKNVVGLFSQMQRQLKEVQDDFESIVAELEQGKFPSDRFGTHMKMWNDMLQFGHYASRVYTVLGTR